MTLLNQKLEKVEDPTCESSTNSVDPHLAFKADLPFMGLTAGELTIQQEKLVLLVSSGMSVSAAGRGAGYASSNAALTASKLPAVQKAIAYYREQMREEVKFERANAHQMYMEAYSASATATEMKNTVDSLVKLHNLVGPDNATQVNININNEKQLERLTDEELLKIAGKDTKYLEPASDE